jgi:hypothetical protein
MKFSHIEFTPHFMNTEIILYIDKIDKLMFNNCMSLEENNE